MFSRFCFYYKHKWMWLQRKYLKPQFIVALYFSYFYILILTWQFVCHRCKIKQMKLLMVYNIMICMNCHIDNVFNQVVGCEKYNFTVQNEKSIFYRIIIKKSTEIIISSQRFALMGSRLMHLHLKALFGLAFYLQK